MLVAKHITAPGMYKAAVRIAEQTVVSSYLQNEDHQQQRLVKIMIYGHSHHDMSLEGAMNVAGVSA